MRHLLIFGTLIFLIFSGCRKDGVENVKPIESTIEKNISEFNNVGQIGQHEMPPFYFSTLYPNPPRTLSVFPEVYSLEVSGLWKIVGDHYVAVGSARGYVYDPHPDNCYSLAEVKLVKNDQIFGNYTPELRKDTGSYVSEASINYQVDIPGNVDLSNVYIVSQSAVWACFIGPSITGSTIKKVIFDLPPIPQQPPQSPTNLRFISSKANMTWNSVLYANSYNIYRQISGYNWELIGTTSSNTYFDYSFMPNPSGTLFYYSVQAVNTSGTSQWSNVISKKGVTYQ